MKVFLRDLSHALSAIRFVGFISEKDAKESLLSLANRLEEEIGPRESKERDDSFDLSLCHTLTDLLIENEHSIHIALEEYRHEWQTLARVVNSKKGLVPPMMLEEFGNAYVVSEELRDASQFLRAAIEEVSRLRISPSA